MKISSLSKIKTSAKGGSPAKGGHGAFGGKKLIVFDLDGTLAPTKARMDKEMSRLITRLLTEKKVAVIGGGKYGIFKYQFVRELTCPKDLLKHLFLFPTTSTSFYRYRKGVWKKVYALELSKSEKRQIRQAFALALREINYQPPTKVYGKVLEDRGTQMTFSAIGQDVVKILGRVKGVRLKEEWKAKYTPLKMKIARQAAKHLPQFAVHAAGYTSIDVTKKGIDKAYGLRQIEKHLHIKIKDMLFVGDAIFPGGNDYAVVRTGVDYMQVAGPAETKRIVRQIINQT